MSDFVNSFDILGDDAVTDSILKRTINSYFDNTVIKIGQRAFYECSELVSVDLPNVTSMEEYAFGYCSKLVSVDLPNVTSIGQKAFYYCSKLTTLILRSETMCTLGTLVFKSTPIESGTGYIYAPRILLSDDDSTKDYRRANRWSALANQFRALEDYTVDGTITGELDPNKI